MPICGDRDRGASGRECGIALFGARLPTNINVATIIMVRITFDSTKRAKTLLERGRDFRRAKEVFAGPHLTRTDDRGDYGEMRFVTAGLIDERIVVIVWTPRGRARRIISMRKGNAREAKRLSPHLA